MSERSPLENLRPAPDSRALAAALAASRAELAKGSSGSWRRDLAVLAVAWIGISVAVIGTLGVLGQWAVSSASERLATLALLLLVQGAGIAAAVAPRARAAQVLTIVLGVGAMAAVVGLRGSGIASALPPWVCTLSHLGVGVVPVLVVLTLLRRAAITPLRAIGAGIGAGTPGAMVGELGCGQSAAHVAIFHLSAWVMVLAICAVAARQLRPRSFAP